MPMRTRTTATPTQTTATARAGAALARCLAPFDADGFLRDQWEHAPVHVPRDEPARFADLLTRADAERTVTATGIRMPGFRLVKAGTQVGGYVRDIPWRPRPFTSAADVRRVLAEFADGATIVLQALHVSHEPIAAFARELELELRHPVQVNAYYTPRAAQGLPVHHDTHDVFVLQASGQKRWLVYEPVLELPLRTQRYAPELGGPGPVVLDVTLRAGDTLYLPRGWLHEAVTSETDSLHLTVGVNVISWQQAIRDALDETGDDVAMRRSIEAGSLDDALHVLAERLGEDDVERRRVARLTRRSRPLLADGFDQLRALDHLDLGTPLERRPAHAFVRDDGDGGLVLEHDGGELLLPGELRDEICAVLEADAPFTAAELPGTLDGDARIAFAARLVREGLVRIVS
jgi:hypothetical protein